MSPPRRVKRKNFTVCWLRRVQRMAAVLRALGVQERPRVDLHAHDCAGGLCHAGLRTYRRDSLRGVWWLCQCTLASRIEDATPTLIISADAGSRGGKGGGMQAFAGRGAAPVSHKPASRAHGQPPTGSDGDASRARP